MKRFIGKIIGISGVICGLYVGGWLMLIKPIIDICQAIDANTITSSIWATSIIKIIFSFSCGGAIAFAGILFDVIISSLDEY